MSNSLDPDQAQHFAGLDLGPNYLQRLSADYTCRHIVKDIGSYLNVSFTDWRSHKLNIWPLVNKVSGLYTTPLYESLGQWRREV